MLEIQNLVNQKFQMIDLVISVLTSPPGNSDAYKSLRITVLIQPHRDKEMKKKRKPKDSILTEHKVLGNGPEVVQWVIHEIMVSFLPSDTFARMLV